MKKLRRFFGVLLLMSLLVTAFGGVAFARTIGYFYFYMTNDNESDNTGVFMMNGTNPLYIEKASANKPAAINCTVYEYHNYNYESTLNKFPWERACDYVWLNQGVRKTPAFLSGEAQAGSTYCIWARRDNRETSNCSYAEGSWSPDNS
jgi:hypothetical protein